MTERVPVPPIASRVVATPHDIRIHRSAAATRLGVEWGDMGRRNRGLALLRPRLFVFCPLRGFGSAAHLTKVFELFATSDAMGGSAPAKV
jgi:hypothetical protein